MGSARFASLPAIVPCAVTLCLARGATFYVDQAVPFSGDGRSWASAFKTIQEGIQSAQPADEVTVAEGTYVETVDFLGKAITVRSKDPSDPAVVGSTVIEFGVFPEVVRFWSGEGRESVIAGFTIASGQVGISCASSSPVIRDNAIVANIADFDQGGGISCYQGSPVIQDNVIASNVASAGGAGIACEGGEPTIVDNLIIRNVTDAEGGAILCVDCTALIARNRIIANSARVHGGGIGCYDSRAEIRNNLIASNTASSSGAGMVCSGSVYTIVGNTIAYNSAPGGGAGGIRLADSSGTIQNCILWGNGDDISGGNVTFSCTENKGPDNQGEGNIHDDPAFENPDGSDQIPGTEDDDYRLSPLSPCIDKGSFAAAVRLSVVTDRASLLLSWEPGLDLSGHSRLSGHAPDMGCHEHQAAAPSYVVEQSFGLRQWSVIHAGPETALSFPLPMDQKRCFFRVAVEQQ